MNRQKRSFVFLVNILIHSTLALKPLKLSSLASGNDNICRSSITTKNGIFSRRQLLSNSGAAAKAITASSIVAFPASATPANSVQTTRAKGAAELDLEFYIRDLVGGNKKEGSISPSKKSEQPPVPPPRILNGPLLPILLNKECTADCIPVQALIQQVQEQESSNTITSSGGGGSRNRGEIGKEIQLRVHEIRENTKRSFFLKTPWKEEEVSDQYYFDFTCYALWKTASELIETNQNRDRFVRSVGRMIISELESEGVLRRSAYYSVQRQRRQEQKGTEKDNDILVGSIPAVMELLELFKTSEYCKSFRIRSSDDSGVTDGSGGNSNNRNDVGVPVFDELDDESFNMVGSANCLVSIYEPATLGASLQITGENSRFTPDFIGTSLAAIWENCGDVKSTWDAFFIDPVYRTNPKDYFPNEQLLQITLNKN